MKKLLTLIIAAIFLGALAWLTLPASSRYREWKTNTRVRITDTVEMEIQDAWIVRASDSQNLIRIRTRWVGGMPLDHHIINASLTDKTGRKLYTKRWYVPLPLGSKNEDGRLFIWEFEPTLEKKFDRTLVLQVFVHPNKDQTSTPAMIPAPFYFFGVTTSDLSAFPFDGKN
ncbi:MAG: hypothetical protein K0R17_3774 [Rariglobus sp.]|jgi:hypothetical protein|nr:hypothetical protein [Rariglobus sp.]